MDILLPVVFSLSSPESGEGGRTVFLYLKMSTKCQQQKSCTFIVSRKLHLYCEFIYIH